MKHKTWIAAAAVLGFSTTALALDYRPMSLRDFIIDADSLAHNHIRVEISGILGEIQAENSADLYASQTEAIQADLGYTSPPYIPLLLTKASRAFRSALFDCRSRGSRICSMTVRGVATHCTLTNTFGATEDVICIEVRDLGNSEQTDTIEQTPDSAPAQAPAATPLSDTTDTEQRIKACVQSPRMAGEGNAYLRCRAQVEGD